MTAIEQKTELEAKIADLEAWAEGLELSAVALIRGEIKPELLGEL